MTSYASKIEAARRQNCSGEFASAAQPPIKPSAKRRKPKGTISLRVSAAERATLERAAAGMPLSAYVRERVFGEDVTPRRTRGKHPVKDYEALGRVMAGLGRSGLSQDLNAALSHVEAGRILASAGLDDELRQACADIAAMRRDLITALGLSARP